MEEKIFTLEEGTLRIDSSKIIISDNSKSERKRNNLSFGLNLLMCLLFLVSAIRDNEMDQIVFWGILTILWLLIFLFRPKESNLSEFLFSNIKSIKVKSAFSYSSYGNAILLASIYTIDNKIKRVKIETQNYQDVEFLNTINSLGIKIKGAVAY